MINGTTFALTYPDRFQASLHHVSGSHKVWDKSRLDSHYIDVYKVRDSFTIQTLSLTSEPVLQMRIDRSDVKKLVKELIKVLHPNLSEHEKAAAILELIDE